MFKLERIEAENFLSFKEFELNLDNQGLILINGINKTNNSFDGNGAGKSTVLNAIIWALFGKTTNSLAADDVVNNQVGKNTRVSLQLTIDDVPHRIERYRKHTKMKNGVKLYRKDKDITTKSAKDTDSAIVELLQVDYTTFTNAVFFGQGNIITFANATDKERKEILERVTGIEVYRKAQEIAKEKVKEQNLIEQDLLIKREKLDREDEHINELESNQKEYYKHTEELLKTTQKQLELSEEDLEKEGFADKIEKEEQTIANMVEPEKPNPNHVPKVITDIQERIILLQSDRKKISQAHDEYNQALSKIDAQLSVVNSQLSGLDTSDRCPTCGTKLDVSHIIVESERLNESKKELLEKRSEVSLGAAQLYKNVGAYDEAILKNQNESATIRSNYEQEAYEEIHKYNSKLTQLRQAVADLHSMQKQAQNKIDNLKSQLSNLDAIPKPTNYDEKRADIKVKIKQVDDDILVVKTSQLRYQDAVSMFSNSGIRSMVLDLVTPFLNERANKYSNQLTGGDIEINFSTQKENKDGTLTDKFDVEIINKSGGQDYRANSGGEKKRIDLAISFALQDLLLSKDEMNTNIALYDECFEALDMVGCENVIEVLREKQKQIGTIFVITHNESLKNLFENIITVEKTDGTSVIKSEVTV